MSSIWVVLGLMASMNLEMEQLDAKILFSYSGLEEEIYLEQSEGFKAKGKEDMFCKLKKNLYGLKQTLHKWYRKFDSFMMDHGYIYNTTTLDHCIYVKKFLNADFIIFLLYIDYILIARQDANQIHMLK